MEYKLEIQKKLEELAEQDELDGRFNIGLNDRLVVLNLPAMFACKKKCGGCYFLEHKPKPWKRLDLDQIREIINHFHKTDGIKFITINGRGDPFHDTGNPYHYAGLQIKDNKVIVGIKEETMLKITYASSLGIGSYVFTAGDNLGDLSCSVLVNSGANVMISLFGNEFIDADFFSGKQYKRKQKVIANNLRRLITTYNGSAEVLPEGITRLGMNYVVGEKDLTEKGITRLAEFKQAANENKIYFHCNTNFALHPGPEIQKELEQLADQYSNFGMRHSLAVRGPCRMGAASTVTVDYDGTLYQCPYMTNGGQGNFFEKLANGTLDGVLKEFIRKKEYVCMLRGTKV